MIYIKNNTEIQTIFIPRNELQKEAYIASTNAYDDGYRDGLKDGKEQQKDKLLNLNVTENGQYEREDGWGVVTVDVPDLNGSYNEGYEQGKAEGIDEQKSKLESINITENGVYSKEDGYNHIEVNVPDLNGSYEEGQADMAAKARILNVTKNGTYLSKFSDPIMPTTVTGVYADGTNFYSYAELNGKVFNTKIAGSVDSRLEFWYKGDNQKSGDAWNVIIGSGDNDNSDCFQVRYFISLNNWLRIEVGNSTIDVNNWDDTVWHHLIVSKAEGLWVDGEKKGDFSPSNTINGEFFINGIGYVNNGIGDGLRNANGTFGMIKIDDVVFIPTADGFLNTNTNELLEVVKDGSYNFTENLPIYAEGELYKTINVNVPDLNGSYDEGKTDGINEQKSKLETINITENGTYNREDGYNHIEVNVPDLNGSYDEGKTDGINEQKSKLETINITQNGTYTKEDGYNHIEVNVPDLNSSYSEGYEQGKADVEANARVLNVTKNGTYNSKFSDPIPPTLVTGRYADGTDFYNYAELNGKVFNTKIAATVDSRLEFWYKGDNTVVSDGWNAIIGAGNVDNRDCFQVRYWDNNNGRLLIEIGNSGVNFYGWDDTVWHHLILSKAEGLWVDGKKEWDFRPSNTINGEFLINGTGYNTNGTNTANGTFGMIKIDDTTIIPTADGFLNTNTGELLEVVKDGGYTFTENLPTYAEGELYKTINVNVPTVQEQITDYYYCPITVTDSGFGDRAKSFLVKNENMYGENGWINDDSFVYLPTANNMNEVRTKTSPSSVASFPFDDNAAHYTGALYMNVEQIQMNNVVLPNLYKLELGSGCHTLRMESSNLPNINTLIIRYNGQQLFDYHFSGTQFKNGGKLYVYEGLGNAENLRAALGSGWTIEYL